MLNNIIVDPIQKQIIEDINNPVRVIASPGSGKTRVITLKYLNLILDKNIDPSEILLLTFSNKATKELYERVTEEIFKYKPKFDTQKLNISTIHSFCHKAIQEYNPIFTNRFSATKILSDISQGSFILSFIEDFGYRSKVGACTEVYDELIPYFNKISDENLNWRHIYSHLYKKLIKEFRLYNKKPTKLIEKNIEKIKNTIILNSLYPIYIQRLKDRLFTDFSNLQKFLHDELLINEQLLSSLQNKYKYLLIDEYQDTSYLQSEIILKIAAPEYNLTICGDDDQSLYRFRGATVDNFLNFHKKIPKATKDYYITTNYRSNKNIVKIASTLINYNSPFRFSKTIHSNNNGNGNIYLIPFENKLIEAKYLCHYVKQLKTKKIIDSYSDVAVLFRSVISDSLELVEELQNENIPYFINGIDKITNSKYLLEFLSLWKFIIKLSNDVPYSKNSFLPFNESDVHLLDSIDVLNKAQLKSLKKKIQNKDSLRYLEFIIEVRDNIKDYKSNIGFFYTLLTNNSVFIESISTNNKVFLGEVSFLSQIISDIDSSYMRTDPYLVYHILNSLTIKGDESVELSNSEGHLNIMTIHQAKGLEFPIVFLPSQHQKNKRSSKFDEISELFHYETNDSEKINEIDERKVLYVGITRAKNLLLISYPQSIAWGSRSKNAKPSRYLEEMKITDTNPESFISTVKSLGITNNGYKTNDVEKKLELSFSKINTYIQCPRKFDLIENYSFATTLNAQISFGLSLHKSLDYIHKNYLTQKVTDYTETELKNIIDQSWIDISYKKRETKQLKETAINYIFKYLVKNKNNFKYIVGSEKSFAVENSNLNYSIRGILDLVSKSEDKYWITDFKVNNIELPIYEFQMELYAYIYAKCFNEFLTHLELYSLNDGQNKRIQIKNIDFDLFEKKINSIIIDIKKGHFPPNISENCNKCPYYNFCN